MDQETDHRGTNLKKAPAPPEPPVVPSESSTKEPEEKEEEKGNGDGCSDGANANANADASRMMEEKLLQDLSSQKQKKKKQIQKKIEEQQTDESSSSVASGQKDKKQHMDQQQQTQKEQKEETTGTNSFVSEITGQIQPLPSLNPSVASSRHRHRQASIPGAHYVTRPLDLVGPPAAGGAEQRRSRHDQQTTGTTTTDLESGEGAGGAAVEVVAAAYSVASCDLEMMMMMMAADCSHTNETVTATMENSTSGRMSDFAGADMIELVDCKPIPENDGSPPSPPQESGSLNWKWFTTIVMILLVVFVVIVAVCSTSLTSNNDSIHNNGGGGFQQQDISQQGEEQENSTTVAVPTTITIFPPFTDQGLTTATIKAIQDPTSPYYLANKWMVNDPHLATYSLERQKQRFYLALIYEATYGSTMWIRNDDWLSYNISECQWYTNSIFTPDSKYYPGTDFSGVCNHNNSLISLSLANNNLTGSFPHFPSYEYLPHLQYFDLSNNNLGGTFPPILSHPTLKTFLISNNHISGSFRAGDGQFAFPSLQVIRTNGNAIRSGIPNREPMMFASLCPILEQHNGTDNQFSGSIPTEMGLCTKLNYYGRGNNNLAGNLPSQLGLLGANLQHLVMSNNIQMNGTIPSQLGALTELTFLDLSNTGITGSIPQPLCNRSKTGQLNLIVNCSQIDCCS